MVTPEIEAAIARLQAIKKDAVDKAKASDEAREKMYQAIKLAEAAYTQLDKAQHELMQLIGGYLDFMEPR
jgi:hypothetical protein